MWRTFLTSAVWFVAITIYTAVFFTGVFYVVKLFVDSLR